MCLPLRESARRTAMHMAANTKANPAFNKNTVAPAPLLNARSPIETPSDPRTPDAGSLSLADAGALSAETNPSSVTAAGTAV
jgi:hypothetical protein